MDETIIHLRKKGKIIPGQIVCAPSVELEYTSKVFQHPLDTQEKTMKFVLSAVVAVLFAAAANIANAQTPQVPAAQAAPVKMAVIDTEAFTDGMAGIKRLTNAYTQIDSELAAKRQDITNKNNRLQALAQKAKAGPLTQAESDEADTLKRDIQRAQEDGQRQLDSLTRQRIVPILNDLNNALRAYAKQRGFDVVIDLSKFQGSVMVLNPGVDMTSAFIADYNSKNPGTAATSAPAAAPKKP
jgi:Skp family chaperone for outer membrane proteins